MRRQHDKLLGAKRVKRKDGKYEPSGTRIYNADGKENASVSAAALAAKKRTVKKANSKHTQDEAQQVLISLIRDGNYDEASKIWYGVIKSSENRHIMSYMYVLDFVLRFAMKGDGIDHGAFTKSVGWYLSHAISHLAPIVSEEERDKIEILIGGWQKKKIFLNKVCK